MAIDLEGVDEYVLVGTTALIDVAGDFSAATWIRPDTDAHHSWFNQSRLTVSDAGIFFQLLNAGPVVRFFARNDAAATLAVLGTTTVSIGAWHHIAITRAGTSWVLYVDGVAEPFTATLPAAPYTITTRRIGVESSNSGNFGWLNGQLEDERVYNRLLSAEEVAILAAGYRGPLGGEVGWWSCQNFRGVAHPDGATLTAATHYLRDESGNGNTGDPINGVIARASDAPRMGVTF